MLRADLENETVTVRNYAQACRGVRSGSASTGIAEDIREILRQEQDTIDLATALGIDVPPPFRSSDAARCALPAPGARAVRDPGVGAHHSGRESAPASGR